MLPIVIPADGVARDVGRCMHGRCAMHPVLGFIQKIENQVDQLYWKSTEQELLDPQDLPGRRLPAQVKPQNIFVSLGFLGSLC